MMRASDRFATTTVLVSEKWYCCVPSLMIVCLLDPLPVDSRVVAPLGSLEILIERDTRAKVLVLVLSSPATLTFVRPAEDLKLNLAFGLTLSRISWSLSDNVLMTYFHDEGQEHELMSLFLMVVRHGHEVDGLYRCIFPLVVGR